MSCSQYTILDAVLVASDSSFLGRNRTAMDDLGSALAVILVAENACSSKEEADVMADIILESSFLEVEQDEKFENQYSAELMVESLVDNLGIEEDQGMEIVSEWCIRTGIGQEGNTESDDESSTLSEASLSDIGYDDTEMYLVDGECELCDRYIKLTKHHLIPKQTWPRIQTKLLHAAEANEAGDQEKALAILGSGLEYLLVESILSSDKSSIRRILHSTCDICRQCHSTVHRTHTNMELALSYSTVENLLKDDQIAKFCKWASKQKAGKYSRA